MKKFFFKDKAPVFKEWLYSYICVAIIPMLVCCGIYFAHKEILISEMNHQNDYVMKTVKKNSEHVLTNVKNMSFVLLKDYALNRVMEMDTTDEYWGDEYVYEINQRLTDYGKHIIGDYSLIYIYLHNTDMVLFGRGVIDSQTFYDNVIKASGRSFEEWKEDVSQKQKITQNETYYIENDIDKVCRGIEYMFSIGEDEATIAIIINENAIFGDILNTEWGSNSEIYLYDSNDRLILSNLSNVQPEYLTFPQKPKKLGKERLDAFVSADMTTWHIVTEIDKSLLYRARYILRWSFAILMILGFAISIFVIRIVLRRNYSPVSDLLTLVESDEKNEFAAVKSSMMSILAENSVLNEENTKQAMKLHNMILEKIVSGGVKMESVYDLAADVLFVHPCFAVAILENNISKTENRELITVSMRNLVRGICRNYECMGGFLEINGNFVCIINCGGNKTTRDIVKITTDIIKKVKWHFDIKMSFSMSSVLEGLPSLSSCYREAEEVEKYKRLFMITDNLCYTDYIFEKKANTPLNADAEKNLIKIIRLEDFDKAHDALDNIFRDIEYDGALNYTAIVRTFEILDRIFKNELSQSVRVSEREKQRLKKAIESASCVQEKYSALTEILKKICNDTIKTSNGDLHEKIKKYIEENYSDANLQVSSVANNFNLSTSYVIKLFKEQTSMTLLEYISECRVHKAAELIREGSYSFEKIAQMTGFNHIKTFHRTFKKVMGVSASNYQGKKENKRG